MIELTAAQQKRVQTLALEYEARRLYATPAECRAAAERMVRDEWLRAEARKSDKAPTVPGLF